MKVIMSMRYSSRLYRHTSNSDLSLQCSERRIVFIRFFLYHLQLAAIFAVLFCGEHDSFLAGDGAREWASRHGLTTGAVDGEVEKVRSIFQCSCYNRIIIRMLNLTVSGLHYKWRLLGKSCHCFSDVACNVRNDMN